MSAAGSASERISRRTWAALGIILVAASLLRVVVTVEHSRNPLFGHVRMDEEFYDAWAADVLDGEFYLDYVPIHGPGYPWFLASVYYVFGRGPWGIRIVQSVLGVITAALGFFIGRRLFGEMAGLAAAFLLAFYWPFIIFEQRVLAVSPLVFVDLVGLLLFVKAVETPKIRRFAAAGIAAGISLIIRPTSLVWITAAAALAAYYGVRGEKKSLSGAAVFIAAAMLSISPVIVKNHAISGEWGLIQNNAGLNLYIGNNPESDGTPYARPGGVWDMIQALPVVEAGLDNSRGQDRFYFDKVLEFMRESPGRFTVLQLRKAAMLVNRVEVRATINPEFHRKLFYPLSLPLPGFGLILACALAGSMSLSIKRRGHAALCLYLFGQGSIVAVTVVATRYRAPFTAGLIPLAGAGAVVLVREIVKLREKSRPMLAPFVLFCAGLAFSFLPVAPKHTDAEELTNLGDAWVIAGNPGKAGECYEKALQQQPDFPQALIATAGLLKTKNDLEESVRWLRRAVDADPLSSRARILLGAALWDQGQHEDGLTEMEIGVSFRPQWAPIVYLLATYEAKAGRNQEAIRHLEYALQLRPRYEEARNLLDNLKSNQGEK